MSNKTATNILLFLLQDAHKNLKATMDGVTSKNASHQPEGTANPIAGTYSHLVFSEDFFTHFFLQQKKPLFESSWKKKLGISEVQPTEWEKAYPKWLKKVTIEVPKAYEYADAVFKATEDFVASIEDEDLDRDVDMSMFGMPPRKVGDFIGTMIIGHCNNITGEISVLKGVQGLKGYPF